MRNFIDKTLMEINHFLKESLTFESTKDNPLSHVDERVKILLLLFFLITISLLKRIESLLFLYIFSIFLALIFHINLKNLMRRTWSFVSIFTLIIVLPYIFIQPGKLSFGFSLEGLESALRLVLRVVTSISYINILLLTTYWTDIFAGLRALKVPAPIISILAMTYRYIFLLLEIAENIFLAKKSRTIKIDSLRREQGWIGSSIGILGIKTQELTKEVYQGMISRGINKDINFFYNKKLRRRDIVYLAFMFLFLLAIIIIDWRMKL
ncbi:MAG: cobalt ECF transporter T component CbiQ [Dictyoglomus sp. NZ13-RE01]|nr:MAG: cobalt ECF transporter T component CbiQ [Dictyoglomus sp. NZ13-RE01]